MASAIRQRWVKVYATRWCPHSQRARALLTRHSVPFEDVDIERDPAAAREVQRLNNGYRSVPTLVVRLVLAEPADAELQRVLLDSGARLATLDTYVTSWCPDCRRTLAWLKEQQIECPIIDIEESAEGASMVRAWCAGNLSVPSLDVTLVLTEPTSDQVEAVLGL